MTDPDTARPAQGDADYESRPLARGEYLNAVIHFYRGEMSRVTSWRQRLDQTTNWAVFTTAAMLSFTFGSPENSHVVILLGNLLLLILLGIEARRFRFFDVWRARLRKLEENFLGPILRRDPHSPEPEWGEIVARDLFQPHFKITIFQAFRRRLLKNYILMFGVTLFAWLSKVSMHPTPPRHWHDFETLVKNTAVGGIPAVVVVTLTLAFYGFLVACVIFEATHTVEGENWGLRQPLDTIDQ
jgi:uncharacterized membrane protein